MDITCKKCGSKEYRTEESGQHIKAICSNCDSYIKFLPQNREVITMPFGKFKDQEIKLLTTKEHVEYLNWMLKNVKLSHSVRIAIESRLNSL